MNLKNHQFQLIIIKLLKKEISNKWRIKKCQKIIFTSCNEGGEMTTAIGKSLIIDIFENFISNYFGKFFL